MFLKLKISATFAIHLFTWSYKWIFRDVAQAGSAPGWGSGGRKFESCRPDLIGQTGIMLVCPVFIFAKNHVHTV